MFWLRFPREFNVLIRFFVSGVTWSVRVSSGKTLLVLARGFPRVALENSAGSLRCRVTSPES